MTKPFKLTGGIPAKMAQLEKILPRIMKKMGTKTYGIIPDSILSMFKAATVGNDTICKACLFKGKVKKVLFNIELKDGKEKAVYSCEIQNGLETRKFKFETNKLSHIMEINVDIDDGALIILRQENENVNLNNIYISALIELNQKNQLVKEFLTKELIADGEADEGI